MCEIERVFKQLINSISTMNGVLSVGRSGGGRPLPSAAGDGDIDVFVYCSAIPSVHSRIAALESVPEALGEYRTGVFSGGHWGTGDLVYINGVETWLMYFTVDEAVAEVDSVLRGDRPDKTDGYFYPTGRCAMLAGIEILCDKTSFLAALKERLATYPEELSGKLAEYHLAKLNDTEDFERAVARGDALFYHFTLEIALDHFLQALFALNRVFFPSRKRSLEYISKFPKKPENCEARLLEVVRLGGSPESIYQSYELFRELAEELNS